MKHVKVVKPYSHSVKLEALEINGDIVVPAQVLTFDYEIGKVLEFSNAAHLKAFKRNHPTLELVDL